MLKLLFILLYLPALCLADLPLYQIGVAVGGGYLADYPGSDQGRSRFIMLPTGIYRGETFKADERGTRANFYQSKYTNIDLSFGASFPANSEDNEARKGMKDLDWLGEIGPRLNKVLFQNDKTSIEVEMPLRFVFSTNFSFTRARGYRLQPQVDFRHMLSKYFQLNFSYKLNWATEPLMDYFYEVNGSDITTERERFNAKAGYIGSSVSTFFVYQFKDLFTVFGARYSSYQGATNEQSPLFRVDNDTAVFLAFNFFFYKSNEKMKRR